MVALRIHEYPRRDDGGTRAPAAISDVRSDGAIVSTLLELAALGSADWRTVLQRIIQVDSQMLGCDRVGFWTLSETTGTLRCECNYASSIRTFERGVVLNERDHPRYFAEVRQARIIIADDARHDARLDTLREYFRAHAVTRLMDVPVWTGGHLAGVLCHEQVDDGAPWSEADQGFAVSVAQVVSTALETRARDRAEQAERRLSFLADVTGALSSTLDVQEVARRAVRIALPTFGDMSVIDLVDGSSVRRAAVAAIDPEGEARLEEYSRRFPPTLEGPNAAVRAMRRGESFIIPDADDKQLTKYDLGREQREFILQTLQARSVMAVPVSAQEQIIGGMVFYARRNRYSLDDLRLAERFGYRVAVVLANAELYANAEEAIRARDEFIAIASHELRTPLTSLMFATEALSQQLATGSREGVARAGQVIARQTHRLHGLVERMLDVSRSGSGRLVVQPERIDLSELLHDMARSLAPTLERAGCQLELHIQPAVFGCWDGHRLEQVVGNLIDNAVKFGKGRPIALSLQAAGGLAVLTVRDHGVGILPGRLPFIFDRFERAVSPREFGGLGLGLYIVRAIVLAHGGTIRVDSRVGEGTTFTVELPGVEG